MRFVTYIAMEKLYFESLLVKFSFTRFTSTIEDKMVTSNENEEEHRDTENAEGDSVFSVFDTAMTEPRMSHKL